MEVRYYHAPTDTNLTKCLLMVILEIGYLARGEKSIQWECEFQEIMIFYGIYLRARTVLARFSVQHSPPPFAVCISLKLSSSIIDYHIRDSSDGGAAY